MPDTAPIGTPGACPAPFQGLGFQYPHPTPNSSQRPTCWVEKAASWRAAEMVAHSEPQPPELSISAQESGVIHYLNPTQGLRLPKAPSWRESGVPAPTSPPGPRSLSPPFQNPRHPGPLSSAQYIRYPSSLLPRTLTSAHPQYRPGTRRPSPLPILPGTRVPQSSRAAGPQGGEEWNSRIRGRSWYRGASSGSGSGCGEQRTGRGRRREQVRRRDSGWREAGPGVEGKLRSPRAPWDL